MVVPRLSTEMSGRRLKPGTRLWTRQAQQGPGVPNPGRLALFFVAAGVDGAVELVFLQLAFDVSS
jgi:hypothetical protein